MGIDPGCQDRSPWAASKPTAPPNWAMRWLWDNPTQVNQIEPDDSDRDDSGTDAARGERRLRQPLVFDR